MDILRRLQQQGMNKTIFVQLSPAGRKKPRMEVYNEWKDIIYIIDCWYDQSGIFKEHENLKHCKVYCKIMLPWRLNSSFGCQFSVLPIECPPGWTFLGDYNNKEWIKLSLFQCPQLVGKSLQRARYVLQCNNRLALISILQTDISLSQDILRHFPFPTWNFFFLVPESLSLFNF